MINRNPDMLKQLFAQCIVLKADICWEDDSIEYDAICSQFDELLLGDGVPMYQALFHSEDGFQNFVKDS